jgi:energy-coupling factor transporter ATP-binding protein EcfA2
VHIRELKIENVRGFEKLKLDLDRPNGSPAGWTVLAGRNGSGKSTLLKAIGLSLINPTETRSIAGSFEGWIRLGQKSAAAQVLVQSSKDDTDYPFRSGWLSMLWNTGSGGKEPLVIGLMGPTWDNEDPAWQEEYPWKQDPQGWFVVGYGPYRRLTGHASDAQRLMTGPERVARLVNLFREDASLIECVTWLREIYLRRLENRPGAAELEQTVLALLNDGLLPDGVTVEGVDSEGLWVLQRGIRLPLNELSDGYRTTAALVMDIVRHMESTFGGLRIEPAEDAEGPFQRVPHTGVVLIDEVDLHLHVSWQKRIGFWLKRHFPNIQFIVTTHSPFICQAADPRGLIRLPAPGEDRPAEHVSEELYNTVVNGSIDDAVLTELFGLETPYSEPAERLREDVARLEAKLQTGKASAKDRRKLEDLRSRLPQNLSTDVEQALRKLAAEG